MSREPGGGSLRATHDVHLGLIVKRVVDFLLVLIELFLLGVTAKALRANIAPTGSARSGRPTNHSSYHKTRLNDLSYCTKIWAHIFLPFCHNPRV